MFPQIHPRQALIQRARKDLGEVMGDLMGELTYGELFFVLADEIQSLAKFLINEERNPSKPVDKPR